MGRGIVGKGAARRAALGLTVALVAAGASGCWWGQPGFGPEHARVNDLESGLTPATVGSLAQAWTLAFPDGSLSEPLVSDGRVFFAGHDQTAGTFVRARRLDTGDEIWTRQIEGSTLVATGVTFSGSDLWVGHLDPSASSCSGDPGRLTSLDPATGDVTSSEATTVPVALPVAAGPVEALVRSTGCLDPTAPSALVVRDTASHATQWTYAFPGPAGGATISGTTIYVSSGGQVYAFDALGCGAPTCDPLWVRSGGSGAIVVAGRMFAVSHETTDLGHGVTAQTALLTVYDARTGDKLWGTSYTGGDPFMGLGRGEIVGLAVTGDTVYVAEWHDPGSPGPAIGTLDAFPAAGCGAAFCSPAWRGSLPGAPTAQIAAGGGLVYAGTDAQTVAAFDAAGCGVATCAPLVSRPVPGQPTDIVVAQGALLVTSLGSVSGTQVTAYRAG